MTCEYLELEDQPSMAITVAVLEERVNGHIKFVWALMGVGFTWLIGISLFLFHMNGTLNRVEAAQSDSPSRMVTQLLSESTGTSEDAAAALRVATSVLKKAKVLPDAPTPSTAAIKSAADSIERAQLDFPDLLQTWSATAAFVNYKSKAVLPPGARSALEQASNLLDCGGGGRMEMRSGVVIVTGCTLDLEKGVSSANVAFINCVIRYRGGSIPIKHVSFKDCLFDLQISAPPPASQREVMTQLTRSISSVFQVDLS